MKIWRRYQWIMKILIDIEDQKWILIKNEDTNEQWIYEEDSNRHWRSENDSNRHWRSENSNNQCNLKKIPMKIIIYSEDLNKIPISMLKNEKKNGFTWTYNTMEWPLYVFEGVIASMFPPSLIFYYPNQGLNSQ